MRTRVLGLVAFLLILYFLPISLLWAGVIPFSFRFILLVILAVAVAAYQIVRKTKLRDLGIRGDNILAALLVNLALSAVIIGLLLILNHFDLIREPTIPSWSLFFAFYVLISSPCQEFLFRSAVFAELERAGITGLIPQVLISAITYSFLHVIYNDIPTLAATILMGVVWGLIYRRWPNLVGVAVSHAAMGAVSIAVGLI